MRQEPAPAQSRAVSAHTGGNATDSTPQQDWFSTALQQSAQLTDLGKQEGQEHEETLLSKKDKKQHKDIRRRTVAAQPAPLEENWFDVALQQSAQLDGTGPRVQAVV